MPFSEAIKLEVKKKSDFRCVVCGMPIVEIHHIIPQEENGPDKIENAVALCAHCHNIYGGNPTKREELIRLRDMAYQRIEEKFHPQEQFIKVEKAEGRYKVVKQKEDIVLKCYISEKEDFEQAATKIYQLIYKMGKRYPEIGRALIIEIQGHRNAEGGYDRDMFELQFEFLTKCILPFVHVLHMPLISIENPKEQRNLECEKLMIFANEEEMKKVDYELHNLQEEN